MRDHGVYFDHPPPLVRIGPGGDFTRDITEEQVIPTKGKLTNGVFTTFSPDCRVRVMSQDELTQIDNAWKAKYQVLILMGIAFASGCCFGFVIA